MRGVTFQSPPTPDIRPLQNPTIPFSIECMCIEHLYGTQVLFQPANAARPNRVPETQHQGNQSTLSRGIPSRKLRESSASEPAGPSVSSQETERRPDLSGYVRKIQNPTDEPEGTNRNSRESLPSARSRAGIQRPQPKWQLMAANDLKAKFPRLTPEAPRPGHSVRAHRPRQKAAPALPRAASGWSLTPAPCQRGI